MKKIVAELDDHAFFKGLDASRLKALRPMAKVESFEAEDFLLREGQPADKFFLIQRGLVAVELHAPGRGPLTLQTLGPHEMLGWSWIVPPYIWSFDARVIEAGFAIVFDAPLLREAMHKDPALAAELLRRLVAAMGSRLRAARVQLLDLYAPHS